MSAALFLTSHQETSHLLTDHLDCPYYVDLSKFPETVSFGRGSKTVPVNIIVNLEKYEPLEDDPNETRTRFIISRCHCKIERIADGDNVRFELVDNESLNGTFVNNVKISRCALNDGDIIQMGGSSTIVVGQPLKESDGGVQYTFRLSNISEANVNSMLVEMLNKQLTEINKIKQNLAETQKKLASKTLSFQQLSQSRAQASMAGSKILTATDLSLDKFVCGLCNEILVNTVTIECGHSFCHSCLEKKLRSNTPFACSGCASNKNELLLSNTAFIGFNNNICVRSFHIDDIISDIATKLLNAKQLKTLQSRREHSLKELKELHLNYHVLSRSSNSVDGRKRRRNQVKGISYCVFCGKLDHDISSCKFHISASGISAAEKEE